MVFHKCYLLIAISIILILLNLCNVEGRHHIHGRKKHKSKNEDPGSPAYTPAPSPGDPVPNSPDYPPPIASDPSNPPYAGPGSNPSSPVSPNPGNSNTGCVFDVTKFGAVGDGSTDDTDAFKAAWKAACQAESSILLAPSDHVFLITSTIFSGPCKPGLVFQVRLQILFFSVFYLIKIN